MADILGEEEKTLSASITEEEMALLNRAKDKLLKFFELKKVSSSDLLDMMRGIRSGEYDTVLVERNKSFELKKISPEEQQQLSNNFDELFIDVLKKGILIKQESNDYAFLLEFANQKGFKMLPDDPEIKDNLYILNDKGDISRHNVPEGKRIDKVKVSYISGRVKGGKIVGGLATMMLGEILNIFGGPIVGFAGLMTLGSGISDVFEDAGERDEEAEEHFQSLQEKIKKIEGLDKKVYRN